MHELEQLGRCGQGLKGGELKPETWRWEEE